MAARYPRGRAGPPCAPWRTPPLALEAGGDTRDGAPRPTGWEGESPGCGARGRKQTPRGGRGVSCAITRRSGARRLVSRPGTCLPEGSLGGGSVSWLFYYCLLGAREAARARSHPARAPRSLGTVCLGSPPSSPLLASSQPWPASSTLRGRPWFRPHSVPSAPLRGRAKGGGEATGSTSPSCSACNAGGFVQSVQITTTLFLTY